VGKAFDDGKKGGRVPKRDTPALRVYPVPVKEEDNMSGLREESRSEENDR